MARPLRDREEGQVIPALLLVVVGLLLLGLLFAQVGSAAEQKTQTRTATDSGAVAAAHELRDATLVRSGFTLAGAHGFAVAFRAVPPVVQRPHATACAAARTNWNSNPHGGAVLDCAGSLRVATAGEQVRVRLLAPAGQVVTGPVDVSSERALAEATARLVVARCGRTGNAIQTALAHWIIDDLASTLGIPAAPCVDAADDSVIEDLDELYADYPAAAIAAVGPPQPILALARRSLRTEIVR